MGRHKAPKDLRLIKGVTPPRSDRTGTTDFHHKIDYPTVRKVCCTCGWISAYADPRDTDQLYLEHLNGSDD